MPTQRAVRVKSLPPLVGVHTWQDAVSADICRPTAARCCRGGSSSVVGTGHQQHQAHPPRAPPSRAARRATATHSPARRAAAGQGRHARGHHRRLLRSPLTRRCPTAPASRPTGRRRDRRSAPPTSTITAGAAGGQVTVDDGPREGRVGDARAASGRRRPDATSRRTGRAADARARPRRRTAPAAGRRCRAGRRRPPPSAAPPRRRGRPGRRRPAAAAAPVSRPAPRRAASPASPDGTSTAKYGPSARSASRKLTDGTSVRARDADGTSSRSASGPKVSPSADHSSSWAPTEYSRNCTRVSAGKPG